MANITNYLKSLVTERSLGKNSSDDWPYSQTWVGLFVSSPTAEYTAAEPDGVEVQGTGYSRKQVTWSSAAAPYWVNNNGTISNSGAIEWNAQGVWAGTAAASTPAPIVSVGVFTSSTAGSLLWYGPLSVPVSMSSGDSFKISSGGLVITLT